jgi:hypothetical protein
MTARVQVCSPDEARRIIAALGPPEKAHETMLHGFVDLTCREEDGSIAWEIHQPNVITDYGRRLFFMNGLGDATGYLFTSPSTETPIIGRYALPDTGNVAQVSGVITHSYDANTLTKTIYYNFPAPASAKQIGTVGVGYVATGVGPYAIVAYTRISPVKTQGTTQTLELQYRITLTPVY